MTVKTRLKAFSRDINKLLSIKHNSLKMHPASASTNDFSTSSSSANYFLISEANIFPNFLAKFFSKICLELDHFLHLAKQLVWHLKHKSFKTE